MSAVLLALALATVAAAIVAAAAITTYPGPSAYPGLIQRAVALYLALLGITAVLAAVALAVEAAS